MRRVNPMLESLIKNSKVHDGENNDCTVFAIANAFELDYDTAHREVSTRFERNARNGVSSRKLIEGLKHGTTINGRTVVHTSIPKTTYKVYGEEVSRNVRLKNFVRDNPEGTYLILIRSHILVCKEGTVLDNLINTADKSIVRFVFKIE